MTKEKFLGLFDVENKKEEERENVFYDPVFLKDWEIGFSVRINYPATIKYKPLVTLSGKIDESCLIHVVYDNRLDLNKGKGKIPIIIRCGKHSDYFSDPNHFDYDFSDKNCPTEESIRRSRGLQRYAPRDIFSRSGLYYDHRESSFLNEKGKKYSGKEILLDIFNYHIKVSRKIVGIPLRAKNMMKSFFIRFFSLWETIFKFFLRFFFGRVIKSEDPIRADVFGEGYKKQDITLLDMDSFSIFGYKASKRVIMTFFFLSFLGYSICMTLKWNPPFIANIVKNPFLTLVSAVVVLGIMDSVIPHLLLAILNITIKLKSKILLGAGFGKKK